MAEPTLAPGAVFLSYAREDAEAARRISDALKAFGVEVWFDQNELRGGEAWDAKIKGQIRGCSLFVPIISANTQARGEGYFRREWKIAVERTHDMAAGIAFFVPVAIDDVAEGEALVPEEFMRVQWTRLPKGVPTPQFVDQVRQLIANPRGPKAAARAPLTQAAAAQPTGAPARFPARMVAALVAVILLGGGAFVLLRKTEPAVASGPAAPAPSPAAAAPAPAASDKSIAVLPFANFSPDKENEFFADGLQDEVITALAKIHDMKVISRTSVLGYKNAEGRNLKKIAGELGVATVLEGSVQRVGTQVHLNVQLIDARSDDHLWAESYTEEMKDVFTLESRLATEIAGALRANLTQNERSLIDRRPTDNQAAYDLYLKGIVLKQALSLVSPKEDYTTALSMFEKAYELDPQFWLAHVEASIVDGEMYWFSTLDATPERMARALAEVQAAQRLAPSAPETHLAIGEYDYTCLDDWTDALGEYQIVQKELPNNSEVCYATGRAFRRLGRFQEALAQFERSIELNPKDNDAAFTVVETNVLLHRYRRTEELCAGFMRTFPNDTSFKIAETEARYAPTADTAGFIREMNALQMNSGFDSLYNQIAVAERSNDLQAALRAVEAAGPDKPVTNSGVLNDPASLTGAQVLYALGRGEEARAAARAATEYYKRNHWTRRQLPFVHMGLAEAELFSGDTEKGLADAAAAYAEQRAFDTYGA